MVSATVVLFGAKYLFPRSYAIIDKREFIQAIDTLVPPLLLVAMHVLVLFCPTCTTHVLRRHLNALEKSEVYIHTKQMAQLSRFILAPQVC